MYSATQVTRRFRSPAGDTIVVFYKLNDDSSVLCIQKYMPHIPWSIIPTSPIQLVTAHDVELFGRIIVC